MGRFDAAKSEETGNNEMENSSSISTDNNISIESLDIQVCIDPNICKWYVRISEKGKENWMTLKRNSSYTNVKEVIKFETRTEAEEFCKNIGLV